MAAFLFRVRVDRHKLLRTFGSVVLLACAGAAAVHAKQQPGAADEPAAAQSAKKSQNKQTDADATGDTTTADTDSANPATAAGSSGGITGAAKDFLMDQKEIWTSPARLRFADADWLIPAAGITAGLLSTDRDVSRHLSNNPSTISHYKTLSTAGVAALVGGAGGMWLASFPTHNQHWRETGFLAGEAAIAALIPTEVMKYSLARERPYQGDGTGPFFSGGTSFPSEHAAASWAVAGVIAHEYPGTLPKLVVYSLASLVSYSRIKGKQHFPSDVFVGSVLGNMVAQNVYERHHDPDLGGEAWHSIGQIVRGDGNLSTSSMGSPYVPLDSWIYEALDRLSAMGLIDSGFAGLRPWTRSECARLVGEAMDQTSGYPENSVAFRYFEELQQEFQYEIRDMDGSTNDTARLESAYTRIEDISGKPMTDGYTFAQTQINDFGRPYGEGMNTDSGGSAYLTHGRWVVYVRGELQTAPEIPAYSLSTREVMQVADHYPYLPPGTAQPARNNFTLLDAYAGVMLADWQITFGKQSLWWGPGDGGPMMLSDNAAPINMFRVNRTTPWKLPSFLGWLGPIRTEFFLGQLQGYDFVFSPTGFVGNFNSPVNPQPFIHGENIAFKPTKNFEFGFFRTTVYGGPGYPLTAHTLLRSLFSTTNESITAAGGAPNKPGDRRSGLDFNYRLPGLRNWLTFYGDGFTDDQFSPIAYADRSAWHAGLYLSQVPLIPKLDLRVEGVYTDLPAGGQIGHGFFYFNFTWRSGYTNNGDLIGSWIGREGQGAQAWTNYWFNARNRIQFNFRHQKVSNEFIPGGGTLTDVGVRGDYWFRTNLCLSASVQYEKWIFPVILPTPQNDITGSIELMFNPRKIFRRGASNNTFASPAGIGMPE
jgi:membrane-associated phospholipid phosphatase